MNSSGNWTKTKNWNLPRRVGAKGWSTRGSSWVWSSRIWSQRI